MFGFSDPMALLLLIPAVLFLFFGGMHTSAACMALPRPAVLVGFERGLSGRWVDWTKFLALVLTVIALAGPRWTETDAYEKTEGIDIVITVDLSESMSALDFKKGDDVLNRLQAVKTVIADFIKDRKGDRIGLVVFGSEAYTQLPLTRDYNALLGALDRIEIGAAGKQTAIGDALGISLKRLEGVKGKSKVIILLTDGRSNTGELDPLAAARIAAGDKVKVYTIGVGGKEPAPFVVDDPVFGRRVVYQQVDIDEDTLLEVAKETDGLYFRAENTEGLAQIYSTIDELEKDEAKVRIFHRHELLYAWFLGAALILICLWAILRSTRFLRIP